ncbi:MAG: M23 family metallopeptidase [Candidatus Cloacimonetes bacterium]|nr:M23 family metallopeptidase [Candidatus Cloacimonadota bacterium]
MDLGKTILLTLILGLIILFSIIPTCFSAKNKSDKALQNLTPNVPQEPWMQSTIPEGGSIYSILEKSGIPLPEIARFSYQFGNYIDVTTLQPGDTLRVIFDPDSQKITKAMFTQEPTIRHHFKTESDTLRYEKELLPVSLQTRIINGELNNTLDSTLLALGLHPYEKQQINNGLEGDINFQTDARNGDKFSILIEERIFEGKRMPRAKILYVSYEGSRTGFHELFRYEEEEGAVVNGLYNKEGKARSTSGVGYPLGYIHVSSTFGRWVNPISGRWEFHTGYDYRASYGTPVYSVANGVVTVSSYNGGWGNEIRIKHPSGMVTQYAHLSTLGVRTGHAVKKGQVIGRIGSTGYSTGPHLHFGLMQGGQWISPANLRMVGAEKLSSAQMEKFKLMQDKIRQQLEQAPA